MPCPRATFPLLAVVLLGGFGFPLSDLILASSTTTTDIAGQAGTDTRTLGEDGDFKALYLIAWAEDADIPCFFRIRTRHLNNNNTEAHEASLGGASCDENANGLLTAGWNNPRLFINGIRVCRNNGRIKGMEIEYADVDPYSSAVTSGVDYDSESRSNCGATGWSPTRYCPNDQVATRIIIHHRADNPPGLGSNIKQSATGIALVCRQVNQKS